MEVSLKKFDHDDLDTCERWARDNEAGHYISRIHPVAVELGVVSDRNLINRFIIAVNGKSIGTIVLAKERPADSGAVLGVSFGREYLLSTEIGRRAVRLAIAESRRALGLETVVLRVRKSNLRAIFCYRKCGFLIVGEGTKRQSDGAMIPFFTMKLELE